MKNIRKLENLIDNIFSAESFIEKLLEETYSSQKMVLDNGSIRQRLSKNQEIFADTVKIVEY